MSKVFVRLLNGGYLTNTYASSLFKIGEKQQNLSAIYQSLLTINDKISQGNNVNSNIKLMNIINNPTLSQDEKNVMLQYLTNLSPNQNLTTSTRKDKNKDTISTSTTTTTTSNIPKEVSNFLTILMDNNRLNLLPNIINDFQSLMNQYNNIINVELITINKLNNNKLNKLNNILLQSNIIKQLTSSNDLVKKNSDNPKLKLNLINKINDNIKGGIIIKINDKTIDLSIATKLQKLNNILNENV